MEHTLFPSPWRYRTAQVSDLAEIEALIREGQAFLRAQGVCQWTGGYPSPALLAEDISLGAGRVITHEDGSVAGYAALFTCAEPTYARIYEGAWTTSAPYVTVHRLGIAAAFRGQGAASAFLAFIRREFAALPLRADTHERNRPMRGMLQKAGLRCCGVIYLADGQKRVAYEIGALQQEEPKS